MSGDSDIYNEGRLTEAASRNDKGKPRWDLLPVDALLEIVDVYTKGAEKYADRNWEQGMSWSRCYRSLLSHITKFWSGRTYDDELKTYHTAMAAWNAIALLTYQLRGVGTDDRPIRTDSQEPST